MQSVKQNTTRGFYIFADDTSAFGTGFAGLAVTCELSKGGAAFASVSPTITDRSNGLYWVAPIAAHRDTLGEIAWKFSAAGATIAPRFENVVAVDDQVSAFGSNTTTPDNAGIEAIKTKTDQLNFSGDDVQSVASNGGGSTSVVITPVASTVGAGAVNSEPIHYYISEGKSVSITLIDQDGNPIDASGKTLEFIVRNRKSKALVFSKTNTDISIALNIVTVVITASDVSSLGTYEYALRDTSDDDRVWAEESFHVRYAAAAT